MRAVTFPSRETLHDALLILLIVYHPVEASVLLARWICSARHSDKPDHFTSCVSRQRVSDRSDGLSILKVIIMRLNMAYRSCCNHRRMQALQSHCNEAANSDCSNRALQAAATRERDSIHESSADQVREMSAAQLIWRMHA